MQEGIIQIGKILMQDGSSVLDNLITELAPVRRDAKGNELQLYVLKFNFSTDECRVSVEVNEQMSEESSRRYCYIGSAPGANSKQWYCTASNSFYHLSETIPNLCELDFGNELNKKLQFIKDTYFVDLGEEFKSNKNRYAFNVGLLANGNFDVKAYRDTLRELPEKEQKALLKKEISESFDQYLADRYGMKLQKNFGLFTILIDDEPLCMREEYKEAILKEKEGAGKQENKKSFTEGHCYSCGTTGQLRDDIIIEIKSYTTNLYGFASGVDKKNYRKNMLLCQDCLNAYLSGEKYVKNNLNLSLARFRVYLYPHFIWGEPFDREELDRVYDRIKHKFNTISNVETVQQLKESMDEELAYQEREDESCYSINLIFYKQTQKATKIQRFIKDVAPSRFDFIASCLDRTQDLYLRLMGGRTDRTILNLRMIYYLMPIRLDDKNEARDFRNLLGLYDAILSGKLLKKQYIIGNLNACARVIYYEEKGFNVSGSELETTVVRGTALIKFLEYMQLIKGGEKMEVEGLHCGDELKEFIREMGYSPEEAALFLLGTLIGTIGVEQYKRTKNTSSKNKPILNKLNFGGMDKNKILRLAGDVFAKLKQEKLLEYQTELIYSDFTELCTPRLSDWGLSKEENLFCILSGYSYSTRKAILGKKKENGGKENEQQ